MILNLDGIAYMTSISIQDKEILDLETGMEPMSYEIKNEQLVVAADGVIITISKTN